MQETGGNSSSNINCTLSFEIPSSTWPGMVSNERKSEGKLPIALFQMSEIWSHSGSLPIWRHVPICRIRSYCNAFCPRSVQSINFSGAYALRSLDCPTYLPGTAIRYMCMEEHFSFPESWKWCLDLHPRRVKSHVHSLVPHAFRPPKYKPKPEIDSLKFHE
jgi:hypothetical protein